MVWSFACLRYNCQYFAIGWVCSSNDILPPSLKLEGRIVEIVLRCAPAHFSVCDSSWVTQYDCNRNGNRAEMLRVCTVRPLSPTLRGSKGRCFFQSHWLKCFGSRIARGRRGKTGFLQMKPGIVVGMPNQLLNASFLEDCEGERENWIFSDETFFYI